MAWLRVTRVMADTSAAHESVLLNTDNINTIEQVQGAVYVYLRDGRHFAVAESLQTLGAVLAPIATADTPSARAIYANRADRSPSAAPTATQPEYTVPPKHILVPLDCSVHTSGLLHYALALARSLQARLTLLHVLEMPILPEAAEGEPSPLPHISVTIADYILQADEEKRRALDNYAQQVQRAGIGCDTVLDHGVPFQQILDLARAKAVDLILMGTQGRTGLRHMLLGSVAEKVVRMAPCPVLVVHSQETQLDSQTAIRAT